MLTDADLRRATKNDRLASSKVMEWCTFTKKLYLFYSQFTDFGPQYLGLSNSRQRLRRSDTNLEADMFMKTVMTALCMAGIAFYVRFLALWTESRPRSSGLRLRLSSGEAEKTRDRAA
jgi:hypothetical protein